MSLVLSGPCHLSDLLMTEFTPEPRPLLLVKQPDRMGYLPVPGKSPWLQVILTPHFSHLPPWVHCPYVTPKSN